MVQSDQLRMLLLVPRLGLGQRREKEESDERGQGLLCFSTVATAVVEGVPVAPETVHVIWMFVELPAFTIQQDGFVAVVPGYSLFADVSESAGNTTDCAAPLFHEIVGAIVPAVPAAVTCSFTHTR